MITDTFDPNTEDILKIWQKEDATPVDACIATFSNEILQYVLDTQECKLIGNIYSTNGANPVYGFSYEDRRFAVYMTPVGAPSSVAEMEDTQSILKTDKYIVFGGSGCLDKEIARGKVMVPTEAYRDEGTSYHYAKASDYIMIKNADIVATLREEPGLLMRFFVRQEETLKKERQTVAFLLRWSAQLFRLCVITEVLMYIIF